MSTFGISQQFTSSVIGRFARESDPVPEKVQEVEEVEEPDSGSDSEYSDEDSDQKYDDKKPKKVVKVVKEQPKVEKEETASRTAQFMNYLLMASRYEERSADHM